MCYGWYLMRFWFGEFTKCYSLGNLMENTTELNNCSCLYCGLTGDKLRSRLTGQWIQVADIWGSDCYCTDNGNGEEEVSVQLLITLPRKFS